MTMKLLVPLDGSALDDLALDFVASRAGWMAAVPEVELLHLRPPRGEDFTSLDQDDLELDDERAGHVLLQPGADRLRAVGVTVRMRHESAEPGPAIVAHAEAESADLVVMASHGRNALGELVLGSVTRHVAAHTRRPLLLLRGLPRAHRQSLRIGVAVDEGAGSVAALDAVLALAPLFGPQTTLTLVRAEGPPPHLIDTLTGAVSREVTTPSPRTSALLAPLREHAERAGMAARQVVLRGWPDAELPRYASEHLDLLAMGSTARSSLSRALRGSVTSRVATTCGVPLLLARPS